MQELEAKLAAAQDSIPAEKVKLYETEMENLREKIRALEESEAREGQQLEAERGQMKEEIEKLRAELVDRQKAYDGNLDAMDIRMKEVGCHT